MHYLRIHKGDLSADQWRALKNLICGYTNLSVWDDNDTSIDLAIDADEEIIDQLNEVGSELSILLPIAYEIV